MVTLRDRRRQGDPTIVEREGPDHWSAAARSSSPRIRRTTSRCSNATRTGTARPGHRRRVRGCSSSATRRTGNPRLKTGQLDAVDEIPPTSVDTPGGWDAGLRGAGARDARLHLQPRPEQARPSPSCSTRRYGEAHRVCDRPQRDRADRVAQDSTPGSTLIPEGDATGGAPWHDDQIQPLPFNIDKANQILDDLRVPSRSDDIRVANGAPDVVRRHLPVGRGRRRRPRVPSSRSASSSTRSAWKPTPPGTRCTRTAITSPTWRCGTGSPRRTPRLILSVITCDGGENSKRDGGCSNHAYDKLYAEQKTAIRTSTITRERPALHHPDLPTSGSRIATGRGSSSPTQGILQTTSRRRACCPVHQI